MQKIRTTFKRSRTPTGAEMKTQSSLEVPKQVRSASFDEMQLEAKRNQEMLKAGEDKSLLRVPASSQRSKSVDAAAGSSEEASTTYLEVPRRYVRRRSSGDKTPVYCVHCQYIDDIAKFHQSISVEDEVVPLDQSLESLSSLFGSSDSLSSLEDYEEAGEQKPEDIPKVQTCSITVTSPPNPPEGDMSSGELCQGRRRSLTSPKLSRQSAFLDKNSSLENVGDTSEKASAASHAGVEDGGFRLSPSFKISSDVTFDLKIDEPVEDVTELKIGGSDGDVQHSSGVKDIFLQVPELKRDRAASVDSCFTKVSQSGKAEEVIVDTLEPPGNVALRSRSVDIVLPTDEQARYKALSMAHTNRELQGKVGAGSEPPGERALRTTPDWSEYALNGEHLWSLATTSSGDLCYVGENDCTKHGPRMRCSACRILAHASCIPVLMNRTKFLCKPTFRDVGVRQYREHTSVQHHWVHRRYLKGKCQHCGKSFQSKLSFSCKDIVALSCSWCKIAYHNKESCFNIQKIGEECNLGFHQDITVPPSWIVKLPRTGSFKSSLRKSPKKKQISKKKSKDKVEKESRAFVIKPIPTASVQPVIVFINPKSGGNQGVKLLQKFQWLLNPRQVFDLSQGGPRTGLEMFRKVLNLRILACGGDGTVGWVLSVLDQIKCHPPPAVAVLPLGTGNDLARSLGWGAGYTDEPIAKILCDIAESDVALLDRWELKVERNLNAESDGDGKENLPLNVVNNYFSLGVDAHIALEFHKAREAHPERFNSRLKNKMFYGQMGGKDLLKRKWKDLSEFVELECDGKDLTQKLKEHKVHSIVFLNIPCYGGGTRPWNRTGGAVEPATDDGIIEVLGLTTYQLPLLQAGGHGTSLAQCREAKIVTTKAIPMQVDGEACRMSPSIITLSLLNRASMLVKRKSGRSTLTQSGLEKSKVSVQKIGMSDYEQHHYDKDLLAQAAVEVGTLEVSPGEDLEHVRNLINELLDEFAGARVSADWCFIDSCTAERFFRVDRAQEHLHYVADIANEILYILDPEGFVTASDDECQATSTTASPASATAPELSDEESAAKPRDPNVKSQVPTISTPADDEKESDERKTQEEGICRSKSAEGISSAHKAEAGTSKPSQKSRIVKSPSAGTGISKLLEKTSENVIKAARTGDLKYLKQLHGEGYSLLSIDEIGQTALHHAARNGHKEIVKFVIANAPATILDMAENEKGYTALHIAAANKQRSISCMLVAGGASLTKKDHAGLIPAQLARQMKDAELAGYLESKTA